MHPGAPNDAAYDGFLVQLAVAALAVTAALAARPFVTYRAVDLGADAFEIGLIQSSFSLFPVLTAVSLGRLVDRGSEARYLLAANVLILAGCTGVAVAGSLVALALGLTVMGFGMVVYLVAGQAMIANLGAPNRRAHRVAWWSTATSIGQMAGPAGAAILVGTASEAGAGQLVGGDNRQLPVFVFAMVMAVLATVLAAVLARSLPPAAPRRSERDSPGGTFGAVATILRRPGMIGAMTVSIAAMSVTDVLVAYLPAYGSVRGLSDASVGLLLAVRAGASLVVRVFMQPLVDRYGPSRTLLTSMAAAGAALLLVPVFDDEARLVALMTVVGLGLGLAQPMTIAWIAGRSGREERATALAVRVLGNRAALLLIPGVMGVLAGSAGLAAIFIALGLSMAGSSVIAATSAFGDEPTEAAAERVAESG